ncbi:MAG: hypothetical protein OEZ43_18865 [Gammaproteobacteria bacterium]|nr:hypothetical protein [Gammaproteobacteria bacterium]
MFRGWGYILAIFLMAFSLVGCELTLNADVDANVDAGNTDTSLPTAESESTKTPESLNIQAVDALTSGDSVQLHVTAQFSDGSTKDVTAYATWSADLTGVVVTNSGEMIISDDVTGSVEITASYESVTGKLNVVINAPVTISNSSSTSTQNQNTTEQSNSAANKLQLTVQNKVTVRVGDVFQIPASIVNDEGKISVVTSAMVWSIPSDDGTLLIDPLDASVLKAITLNSPSKNVTVVGSYTDGRITAAVEVTVEVKFVDSFTVAGPSITDPVAIPVLREINNSGLLISAFMDNSGIVAKSYGSPALIPGLVVRYRGADPNKDEEVVLVLAPKADGVSAVALFVYYSFWTLETFKGSPVQVQKEYLWLASSEHLMLDSFSQNNGLVTGVFAANVCPKVELLLGICGDAEKFQLTGSFATVVEPELLMSDAIATAVPASSRLVLGDGYPIGTETVRLELGVAPGLDYEFQIIGADVEMSIENSSCTRRINCSITPIVGKLVFLIDRASASPVGTSNFSIVSTNAEAYVVRGSINAPIDLGMAPFRKKFQIGGGSNYYKIGIDPARKYWIKLDNRNNSNVKIKVYSDAAFTQAITYTPYSFDSNDNKINGTPVDCSAETTDECTTNFVDRVDGRVAFSDLYVEVINPSVSEQDLSAMTLQAFFEYEIVWDAGVLTGDVSEVSLSGQVGPQHFDGIATGPSVASYYGFEVKYTSFYNVEISGVSGRTEVYVNTNSGTGSTPCSTLVMPGETMNCIFNNISWATVSVNGAYKEGGTTYNLKVTEIPASEVYQVNMRGWNSALGYPFVSVFSSAGNILYRRNIRAPALGNGNDIGIDIVKFRVPPGDKMVYLNMTDVYINGGDYLLNVTSPGGQIGNIIGELDDKNIGEPMDNSITGATKLLLNVSEGQSRNKISATIGDTDWFKFCPVATDCP